MRVVWREDLGEVEGTVENFGREYEGEVAVVGLGDLGDLVGKHAVEGDGGVVAVMVWFVGGCGARAVGRVTFGPGGECECVVVMAVVGSAILP
jgi:hypothetical protein